MIFLYLIHFELSSHRLLHLYLIILRFNHTVFAIKTVFAFYCPVIDCQSNHARVKVNTISFSVLLR